MCTPRYDVTLDQFMRVAHPLPRRRGNVAARQPHVRQRPAVDVPHGSPVEGPAGVLQQVGHRLRRFDRWSGDGAMERLFTALREERIIGAEIRSSRHGLHERGGPPARGRGAEKGAPGPSASPPGAEHGRTRLQPHEALPQGRHPLRQARRGLPRRPRLILIAIYLKKHSQNPTSVNTP